MMMAQRRSCSFALLEDLQAKLLGIPYKNGDLSMFLLLPDDVDGLEEVRPRRCPCSRRRPGALRPELVPGEPAGGAALGAGGCRFSCHFAANVLAWPVHCAFEARKALLQTLIPL